MNSFVAGQQTASWRCGPDVPPEPGPRRLQSNAGFFSNPLDSGLPVWFTQMST